LYFRMAKFGRDRMPHIGSELADEQGLQLIERWIAAMSPAAGTSNVNVAYEPFGQSLTSPAPAMRLARKLGRGELANTERDQLLAAVTKLPASPLRDLFDGFLPTDGKGERKLGSNPRPKAILAIQGDAGQGERIFWSKTIDCGKCHRVDDRGTPVGPDLSAIGKTRSRNELLESLLSPSRRIEPKYAAYLANTADGQSLSGVLVKRDENFVVLRDGQGKEVTLPSKEVEALRPLHTSLMPDGQMAGLTAAEAADLLEYLATRRNGSAETLP
jgi:putative heme-binding domain-containing protein